MNPVSSESIRSKASAILSSSIKPFASRVAARNSVHHPKEKYKDVEEYTYCVRDKINAVQQESIALSQS